MTKFDVEYARDYVEKSIKEVLNSFVGRPNTQHTVDYIKYTMKNQMSDFVDRGLMKKPLDSRVEIDGTNISVKFFDPETGDQVSFYDMFD